MTSYRAILSGSPVWTGCHARGRTYDQKLTMRRGRRCSRSCFRAYLSGWRSYGSPEAHQRCARWRCGGGRALCGRAIRCETCFPGRGARKHDVRDCALLLDLLADGVGGVGAICHDQRGVRPGSQRSGLRQGKGDQAPRLSVRAGS